MMLKNTVPSQPVEATHGAKGFSLVELSIVLLISGILLAAWIQAYNNYIIDKARQVTIEHQKMLDDALFTFFGQNGRYPCPADPTLPPTDPNYGVEQCRATPGDPCPAGVVCVAPAFLARDADNADGDNNPNTGMDPVMIGAIPITTLIAGTNEINILPLHGVDGWDNKFGYAVSELMTDNNYDIEHPAKVNLGAIDLRDEWDKSIVNPEGSAHYVVISYGRNGRGARTRMGPPDDESCTIITAVGPPPVMGPPPPGKNIGTAGIPIELENCDNDDAVFVKGLRSEGTDDEYFDDIVYFKATGTEQLWRKSPSSGTDTWYYNTNLGNVAVGMDPLAPLNKITDPAAPLHVGGVLRAEGQVEAQGTAAGQFCDEDGDDCADAQFLGTDLSSCPAGEAVVGIENNQLVCQPIFVALPPSFDCPGPASGGPAPQQYIYAISNLGNYRCAAP